MMRSRLVRVALTAARSSGLSQQPRHIGLRIVQRRYCAAQPVRTSAASESQVSKPSAADKAKQSVPSEAAAKQEPEVKSINESPATKAPAAAVSAETADKAQIPDVPSTSWSSIGFEEADVKDPNRWKKFAWKYAGAVLLFMISYKSLHWYVDRLEADGVRRREEMEENKEIVKDIRSTDKPAAPTFEFMEQFPPPDLPKQSSELDELYAYKTELEVRLKELGSQSRSAERDTNRKETRTELKDIANEIRVLEANRKQ